MSFLVCHMQKIKKPGVKGLQFHIQRERESKTNKDINRQKSHLNYDLCNHEDINFNKKVDNIISKNVITERAIRKDAIVVASFIVTSDFDFFNKISNAEQQRFFKESYKFLSERYGESNVVYARIHLDEKTPHMHMGIVPVTEDNRLSAKSIFTKKELTSIQDDFYKFINEKGFDLERGISSNRKHVETREFKAKTLEQKIKGLELKRNNLQNDLNALKNDLNIYNNISVTFNDINCLKAGKCFLNNQKVFISEKDFETLKSIAKKQLLQQEEIKNLKQKIKNLKNDAKDFEKYCQSDQKQKIELGKQIIEQKEKLDIFQDFIKQNNQVENLKDFLEERNKKAIELENESWEMEL